MNSGIINALAVQRDGKILIGGFFQSYNGVAAPSIVRVNADGTTDQTFGVGIGPSGQVFKFVERQNGNILAGGQFPLYNNHPGNLVELKPDGTLHKVVAVVESNWITSIIEDSDQKITIAGEFHKVNGTIRYWTAGFNSDYTPNNSFVPHISYTNTNGRMLEIRKNGAVITGGANYQWLGIYNDQHSIRNTLVQFNTLGGYDNSFAPNGLISPMYIMDALFIQDDDKIVVSGDARGLDQTRLARLNADGSLDNSFAIGTGPGHNANLAARIYCIKQRGKVLYIAGLLQKFNETPVNSMVALNLDGSIRNTFQLPANTTITAFDFQSDGKIIALGYIPSSGGTVKRIVRINTDGTLDDTFTSQSENFYIDLQIDSSDRIYLTGGIIFNGSGTKGIVRLLPDGQVDPGFSTGTGFDKDVRAICVLANESIAVGGNFSSYNGKPAEALVILDATGENITPSDINFGPNSNTAKIKLSYGALFLAGRFVKEDNTDVYGNVKVALPPLLIPVSTANSGLENEGTSMSAYPIPAHDRIFATIPHKSSTGSWWLLSTSGDRIPMHSEAYDEGVVFIDVQSVASGIYVLQHIDGKTTWRTKIIKQ